MDILTRPKAKLPGDWAIRYAAMVLVTLIITYKLVLNLQVSSLCTNLVHKY